MSKVVEVTDRNFEEEVLNSDVPTEVDFWAPWCGPCQRVIPIYEKLSEEYEGKFKFCMINVDKNQQTATKYQIMSIPMQMFFSDGEKVDEILGAVPEPEIRAKVDGILQSHPADEMGRLKALLTSWDKDNRRNSGKFSKWLEKVKQNLKGKPSCDDILEAVAEVEKANEMLSRALTELQGEK